MLTLIENQLAYGLRILDRIDDIDGASSSRKITFKDDAAINRSSLKILENTPKSATGAQEWKKLFAISSIQQHPHLVPVVKITDCRCFWLQSLHSRTSLQAR